MFPIAVVAVLVVMAFYWIRYRVWANSTNSKFTVALLLLILATLIYVQRPVRDHPMENVPTLITITTDVSLSMATMPNPRINRDPATRLERAKQVLLPVLTELDASTMPLMMSVTAFTSKSETILAWDDSLPQIREAIEYVLVTGLLTEPGSDLGAALMGANTLFESLPEAYRNADVTKFLIVVSDGEQTVQSADLAAAMAALRKLGVRIISLHVGLPDTPEGLPVYDDAGDFVGFDEVSGQVYSVPDPAVMELVAGNGTAQGLFVKAEDLDTADRILEFIGIQKGTSSPDPLYLALVLGMWVLTMLVLLKYV